MRSSSKRTTVESALGLAAGLLALVTVVWPDWIELLTGIDPDHHNGSIELFVVVALFTIAASLGADIYRLRRLTASTAARGATR
ncbi:MAG: hypothetical protein QOC82_484 [Frankiaceae bacterium]|jgi:hypothetical protein|nr:hypothetical protein [Frankiaceae bacterium]MDQ1699886.1 hypothetical protein [Frankiaceae bacterium]